MLATVLLMNLIFRTIRPQLYYSAHEIYSDFHHKNVLRLIGVSMPRQESPYLILPFCEHGDLRTYLRNPKHLVITQELIEYGHGVCSGMEYLASKGI